jgi:dCTP diphosphatase
MMFDDLTARILEFRDARDWKQYHSPKNLAGSIVIESAELLETLQWSSDATMAADVEANRGDISRELADIVIYCLLMARETEVDLESAINAKLEENQAKYPEDKARGRREKYTSL